MATDVTGCQRFLDGCAEGAAAEKVLLLDLADLTIAVDNYEGMAIGPLLPDGRRLLLLVNDDNYNPRQLGTQFLAFALTAGIGLPGVGQVCDVDPLVNACAEYADPMADEVCGKRRDFAKICESQSYQSILLLFSEWNLRGNSQLNRASCWALGGSNCELMARMLVGGAGCELDCEIRATLAGFDEPVDGLSFVQSLSCFCHWSFYGGILRPSMRIGLQADPRRRSVRVAATTQTRNRGLDERNAAAGG